MIPKDIHIDYRRKEKGECIGVYVEPYYSYGEGNIVYCKECICYHYEIRPMNSLYAVSYTHLDVYKRQEIYTERYGHDRCYPHRGYEESKSRAYGDREYGRYQIAGNRQ